MTVLLRDDFTGSGSIDGRTPDGVHTGTWADDSYFGGAASNTNITGGELIPLTPFRFGASIDLAGSPTNAYIDAHLLSSDITYSVGAKTLIGLGSTIGSGAVGVFCSIRRAGATSFDLDLTIRHSDFASGTTTLTGYDIGGASSMDDFRFRLEVQGTDVAVLVSGAYVMRAVLNAPMAAGRAFIGAEFADTTFGVVQAGALSTYAKPPLLNLSGTIFLETFSGDYGGGEAGLEYGTPEYVGGSFAGVNYSSVDAYNAGRNGGWYGPGMVYEPSLAGGVGGVSEVTADMIFRTTENLPTSYAVSGDLVMVEWRYFTAINTGERSVMSVTYLTAADATALVGGGAVAGYYLKVIHLVWTNVVADTFTQDDRYTLLAIGPEEVHHIRVDQFRGTSQQWFFDDVLIDTTSYTSGGGTHKLLYITMGSCLEPVGISDPLGPPVQLGGIRIMPATSFFGPPFFWRDLITCVETR